MNAEKGGYFTKVMKLIKDKEYRFLHLSSWGFYDKMGDEEYLKRRFKATMGKDLNLETPMTFNEKLQWLKLHDRKPEYTMMVDKYAVKEYVAGIIGEEYIIPTLGVWDSFDEIDFNCLPDQFVLKCTHDSGGLVICRDKTKLDIQAAKKKINKALKRNYYYSGREWPYKNVKLRIIAEEFLTDKNGELPDYKVHCFNGVPRVILVCKDRFEESGMTEDFFTETWGKMPLKRPAHPNTQDEIPKPKYLDKMLELSRALAKDIPFVRIDFYEVDDKLYFGEITFYPANGMEPFEPESYDRMFGDWIELPVK